MLFSVINSLIVNMYPGNKLILIVPQLYGVLNPVMTSE